MPGQGPWSSRAAGRGRLDGAFHPAFESTPFPGKRIMLAQVVSGSMGALVHGLPYLS